MPTKTVQKLATKTPRTAPPDRTPATDRYRLTRAWLRGGRMTTTPSPTN